MLRLLVAVLTAFTLLSWPVTTMAQPPAPRVDFGRDVQPILSDRCYGCHGPDQQMNGFRLDRRADALRGGSQTVIGPGNAEGTLLYRRLVEPTPAPACPRAVRFQPPKSPSSGPGSIRASNGPTIWLAFPSSPPVDPAAERLATLIRDGDRGAIEVFLRASPGAVRARAREGRRR